MGELMKERLLVALGGLFHDVGKLAERAGYRFEGREDLGYAHAGLSYGFIEEVFKGRLREEDYEVIIAGAFHHKPAEEYGKLFQEADRGSSKERSEKTEEQERRELKRLRPVFLGIRLEGFQQNDRDYYIDLNPLELDKDTLFPKEGEPAEGREQYKDLYEKLKKDVKSIDLSDPHRAFLRAYHTFYRYCWCVPASTYDRDQGTRHYPDISLFDHSRSVSAIACALTTQYNKRHKDKRFVIVDGDISGIQEFLFSLANVKGVAKRLRGRSFFLSMLPHLVARAMLWEFEYPLCNLLYAGGGKFLLLLGYEEGIEERLKDFAKRVERSLIKAFGGKLGFVLSWVHTDMEGLTGKGFREVMKGLHERVSVQKSRKFSLTMGEFESLVEGKKGEALCPSCRWEMIDESQEVCRWCEAFYDLGNALLKAKYVAFDYGTYKQKNHHAGFYLEDIGGVYLFEEKPKSLGDFKEVYFINRTDFLEHGVDGFIFFANYAPRAVDGTTADFETLAERAQGDKKIAFVRGDVDFLGLIFQSLEEYSISRIATLSRSLDLFFSGYMNTFLEGSDIYTLYAGGDDFFLVGPWDQMVQRVKDLKEDFDHYTAYNPALNFSVGFHIDRPDLPVRFAGEYAEREEKRVKEEKTQSLQKDSEDLPHFSLLGELLTQEGLSESLRKAGDVIGLMERKKVGRSALYRFYMLMRYYREQEESTGKKWWRFYPLFYYQLYRNVNKDSQDALLEAFINREKDYTLRGNALFLAKYLIMKTRNLSERS